MRAIDADSLVSLVKDSTILGDLFKYAFVAIVNGEPTIEPTIIQCKDCKHWREGDAYSYCQKLFNCGVLDVHDYMRAEEDFCSLAERQEK